MSNQRITLFFLFACSVFVSGGCGERDEELMRSLDLLDPAGLKEELVFVDRGGNRAYVLSVADERLAVRPTVVELPSRPALAVGRNGSAPEQLLVLCDGQDEDEDADPQPPALLVLTAKGIESTYELPSAFDTLVQSDDGRYAFALFQGSAASGDGPQISRRTEAAIVDLSEPPKAGVNPSTPELRSREGSAPTDVVLSPEMNIVGETRRLAVVLFKTQVLLFDLTHLDRPPINVPLGEIEPEQVLFGAQESRIYLRGARSDDIYVMDLNEIEGKENDFWPSIKELAAGEGPADMQLYGDADMTRLLVVSEDSGQALVMDADSSQVTKVQLEAPANRMLLFESEAPFDEEVEWRALLYSDDGDESDTIAFLDLGQVEERGARNLETVSLDQPFDRAIALAGNLVALVRYNTGVSLLDLAERTLTPVDTSPLSRVVAHPDDRGLWLVFSEEDSFAYLDVADFESGELGTSKVTLDAEIELLLPFASADPELLVAVHASPVGHITVLDAENPDRDTALSVRGFFLAGALDRGAR